MTSGKFPIRSILSARKSRKSFPQKIIKGTRKVIANIVSFLLNSGLTCSILQRKGMTGGAQPMKTRIPSPIRRRLISLVGLILTTIRSLAFLARNASLTPDRVNNRIILSTVAPSDIICFERMQDTLRVVTRIATVIIVVHLTLPLIRSTLWTSI